VAPVDRIQVVVKVQRYVAEGKCWVVALDLEKFFNRVNHDKLMAVVARWVADKRVLTLCGHFPPRADGEMAPPPLLSNLVLNELDRLIRNSFWVTWPVVGIWRTSCPLPFQASWYLSPAYLKADRAPNHAIQDSWKSCRRCR
jgi:hypothetical protein